MKKIILVLFAVQFICNLELVSQNVISTIAGGGSNYGEGVLATNAILVSPSGIAVDSAGVMYIADGGRHRVRKVTTSGYIYPFAGTGLNTFGGDSGLATAAYLNAPNDVCIGPSGNIFISDYWNNRTRVVNSLGYIYTYAGNGSPTYNGLGGSADTTSTGYNSSIEVTSNGDMYIADTWFRSVLKINTAKIVSLYAGTLSLGCSGNGGPALSAEFTGACASAMDASGNLYVADFNCHDIRKIDPQGNITAFAGNGTAGFSGDGGPATDAQLNLPNDVAVDNNGNVYITDQVNNRIRMVNPAGIITTYAGNGSGTFAGDGGAAVSASLKDPDRLAFDNAGNLLIADRGNGRIRKVTRGACNSYFYIFPDTSVPGLYYGRNLATGSNLTYLWSFGDGATSTQQYPTHTYAAAGQYYVCLTVNNGSGCVATYCDSSYLVFKTEDGLMNQLTILSPDSSTSVNELPADLKITVYPNPTASRLTANLSGLQAEHISIYNVDGKLVTETIRPDANSIDISGLIAGIYIAEVKTRHAVQRVRWVKM